MKIICLGGFFGQKHDWDFLGSEVTVYEYEESEIIPFPDWAEKFNKSMPSDIDVIIGYSLGGRLALHALLQTPSRWKAAVIVSAHPGLSNPQEKDSRLRQDKQLASKFEKETWDSVIKLWDAQPIFAGRHSPIRGEKDYSRKTLSKILETWSLALQDDLRENIGEITLPILWITGAEDSKFSELACSIKFFHFKSQVWIAPNAAHRVTFDQPYMFKHKLEVFLHEVLT